MVYCGRMRYLFPFVLRDLEKKMAFVGGPRQVGKTTLAKSILDARYPGGCYLNWDFDPDRLAILERRWTKDTPLLVFDEIHKYPRWKSWLKGLYDVRGDRSPILVTGSARLDAYRRGGDSLMGRYHYWRLHPFTLDECPAGVTPEQALTRLLTVGGFPEPFLDNDEREARRWRRERFDRVLREDVRDLEAVRDIQTLGLFVDLLRRRVGGMVVLSNLAADLHVTHKTVKAWLEALERMYLLFQVRPFTRSLPRAIRKPPKVYFYDNADVVGDPGARFENLVATHLLKRLQFLGDRDGFRYELAYLRDKEGREVDFVVLRDGEIEELVEVKTGDAAPSRSLRYYTERLRPHRAVQIVADLDRPFDRDGIRVTDPISHFCAAPPWELPTEGIENG
jgi:predicted AAA+ superfamily ATPase